jgi:periplasmic protein CpxP/Spy
MKKQFIQFATAGALAAGMMFAQTPSSAPAPNSQATPGVHSGRRNFAREHLDRIAQKLGLSDAQKQQARSIFEQAREQSQPIRQQLKQNREAMAAAVKANQVSEIHKLAHVRGDLVAKQATVRGEASAKFYAILTPEQRVKADQMRQQFRERRRERFNAQQPSGGA